MITRLKLDKKYLIEKSRTTEALKKMHIRTQSVHARTPLPQDQIHRRNGVLLRGLHPDDLTLMDRKPRYDADKHLGARPPTPIQQRELHLTLKAGRKKT